MPNKWINALKEFNGNKSEWCIPKKGGKEYEEIKKIMNKKNKYLVNPEEIKPLTKKQQKEQQENIRLKNIFSRDPDMTKFRSYNDYNNQKRREIKKLINSQTEIDKNYKPIDLSKDKIVIERHPGRKKEKSLLIFPSKQEEKQIPKQKKENPWITHVRRFAINRGITYIEALKQAKATYNKDDYK